MRFVKSAAPYPAYIGGIGSGKSFAGGAKVISRIGRKELGMIAAPTYQMLRDSTLRGLFDLLNYLEIPHEHHKSENTITFSSGHTILCRSLEDPSKVRGPNLNYVWVDEAGYITSEAWKVVKGRVRVGDLPQAWTTSTPKGRNWMWEEWERDSTGNEFDPTHPLFRVRTEENPELPAGFSRSLGYEGQFADQELGGEFVAFEGLVYPTFSRSRNVRILSPDDLEGWERGLWIDIGTRNPTAILTAHVAGERIHIGHEVYRRGMSSDDMVDTVAERYQATGANYAVIDPSAAALILSLQRRGVVVRKGVNDVQNGILTLTSRLADLTIDPVCIETINEFESYRYPDGTRSTSDAPVKEHDHAMDAIRYGVMDLMNGIDPHERLMV